MKLINKEWMIYKGKILQKGDYYVLEGPEITILHKKDNIKRIGNKYYIKIGAKAELLNIPE